VLGRLACPSDPYSYVGQSLVLLAGTPMPNRSKGRGQTKSDPTGPPRWGLGIGLISLSRRKRIIIETRRPYVPRGTERMDEDETNTLHQTPIHFQLLVKLSYRLD